MRSNNSLNRVTINPVNEAQREQIQSFIQSLTPLLKADIASFCEDACERTYAKGEDFICAGEVCQELIFIHQGAFRYYLLTQDKEHTKDFSPEGTFCTAFTSLVTRTPSDIFIGALEPSQVCVWKAEAFLERAETSLAWQRLFRLLAQGLYIRKEQREISLLVDDAKQRYIRFQQTFPSLAEFKDVEERVPQHMIASYLGMSPETLSRVRRELRS
jgi:CRP-like cAMP-binding protein